MSSEQATSEFRLRLYEPSKSFGTEITEARLQRVLESHGRVWSLETIDQGRVCIATLRDPEAVVTLLAQGKLQLGGLGVLIQKYLYAPGSRGAADEEKFKALFSIPASRSPNIRVTESRDPSQPVPPGCDLEWRIQLSNRSTQTRELLAIEIPNQTHRMFQLRGTLPTANRPIRLTPSGTHTQGVKFSSKPDQQGAHRITILFNFGNWVLEHEMRVNVAHPNAAKELQMLEPTSTFKPRAVPQEDEPELLTVPAFQPGRAPSLPGAKLYVGSEDERTKKGERPLPTYPMPDDIVQVIWRPPHPGTARLALVASYVTPSRWWRGWRAATSTRGAPRRTTSAVCTSCSGSRRRRRRR